ncbi:hypothetical protein RA210_U40273 [Rubrivivax sp. A210]|nr:hypothetical protein RA210_U40273 [Rubrivivax sp. A210]
MLRSDMIRPDPPMGLHDGPIGWDGGLARTSRLACGLSLRNARVGGRDSSPGAWPGFSRARRQAGFVAWHARPWRRRDSDCLESPS